MKIFFSLPDFDRQLLRTLTYIPAGGADLGECLMTAARIKEGDFDSWHQEWTATADRIMQDGNDSLENNHSVSACQAFLRASNYYRTSFFFLAGAPVEPRLIEAYAKHVESFDKAAALLPCKAERVQIPFENTHLSGYFYKCHHTDTPKPTILTFPGYDGTQQEMYFSVAVGALQRDFNVLCIDGPGQGQLLINEQIPMTPQWERVVTPAVDYLLARDDVNSEAIAIFGESWGGMLASLAACKEHRLAALITCPGQYEALLSIRKVLPQVEQLLEENDFTVLDNVLTQILADKMVANKFKFKMWVHGVETATELLKAWRQFTLAKTASQIKCPTLIIDSENELFSTGQAKQLFNALECEKEYILCKNAEGAGEHCGAGALVLTNQRIYNWLENTIKSIGFVKV